MPDCQWQAYCMSSPSLASASTLSGSLLASSDAAFFSIKLNVQTCKVIPSNTCGLWSTRNKRKMSLANAPNQPQRQSATGTRRLSSSAAPRSPSRPPRSGPSPPRQTRPTKLHCAIMVAGLVRARRTKLSDGGSCDMRLPRRACALRRVSREAAMGARR
jgi:hypothetical protein